MSTKTKDIVADDTEVSGEADDIAVKLINFLVEGFKTKEKRDPTGEEVEELLSELTEERIASLLAGEEVAAPAAAAAAAAADAEVTAADKTEDDAIKAADAENVENTINKGEEDKTEIEKVTGKKRQEAETEDGDKKEEEVTAFKWPKVTG